MFISDQFEVLGLLGKGGNGAVYKAKQMLQDRTVAIKVLNDSFRSDQSKLRRFQREAKTTSALDHPNIVKVFAFGLAEDQSPYFAMEYLEGITLAELLQKKGRLNNQEFSEIFLQVCAALEYAHERGVVHRDLKPENIMIIETSTGNRAVKLLDFGIASQPENSTGQSTTLIDPSKLLGSPLFMSPEQCQGQRPDARSDIYSLACIMYQAVAGAPPFTGSTAHEVLLKQLHEPPSDLLKESKQISTALSKIILRCLEKEPDNRIQSLAELSRKLPAAIQENSQAKSVSLPWNRSIALTMILLLIASFAMVYFVTGNNKSTVLATRKEQEAKPDFRALNERLKEAKNEDQRGKNQKAEAIYRALISEVDKFDSTVKTPSSKKLARLKYSAYRGIINARFHSENTVGSDSMNDWMNCYQAAMLAYEHGSKQIAEAQTRLAFEYMINGPAPHHITEIEQLCRKAMKSLEIELRASENAPFFKLKSDALSHSLYADANIIFGHLRDLQGRHKEGVEIMNEYIRERDSKIDERFLFEREWLCEGLSNINMPEATNNALDQFASELNSEPKINAKIRLRVLDTLLNFYFEKVGPMQSSVLTDRALKRFLQASVDPRQIALCYYYKALSSQRQSKQHKNARIWMEKARAELEKTTDDKSDLLARISKLEATLH